jgi:hypothetical protein
VVSPSIEVALVTFGVVLEAVVVDVRPVNPWPLRVLRARPRITPAFLTVLDVSGFVLRRAIGQDRRCVVRPCPKRPALAITTRLILGRPLRAHAKIVWAILSALNVARGVLENPIGARPVWFPASLRATPMTRHNRAIYLGVNPNRSSRSGLGATA